MINLPRPISTNNLFANVRGKGRGRAGAYNAWIWRARAMLAEQKPLPKFQGAVHIALWIGEDRVGKIDTDNCAKAYLDVLVVEGVIEDDNRKIVRSLLVGWLPGEGCRCVIWRDE